MASGTIPAKGVGKRGTRYILLDAVAVAGNGVWVDTTEVDSGSLEIIFTGTGTVQFHGSEADTRPLDSADGYDIGDPIVSTDGLDQGFSILEAPRWLKCDVVATTGTVTVLATIRQMTN